MDTADNAATDGYVDIYLLPVPEKNIEAYRRQATIFGEVAKQHGALSYREFRGDDLGDGFEIQGGDLLTAAVAEFEPRAHRDEVMDHMRYGGFQTFVNP